MVEKAGRCANLDSRQNGRKMDDLDGLNASFRSNCIRTQLWAQIETFCEDQYIVYNLSVTPLSSLIISFDQIDYID